MIVAYPAGGPTDTVARLATQNIAEQLGQGMIVENVAGAGGRIGTRDVARAAPDGYTLLLGGTNDNAIAPVLYKSLDYDPAKDFVPVSALATDSNAIVVNPEVPVHTLAELASYTKANPGKLTSGATHGIAPHLMLEFIRVRTGADMVFVPYKGAAPAIADEFGNRSGSMPAPSRRGALIRTESCAARCRAPSAGRNCPTCRRCARAGATVSRPRSGSC